MRRRQARAVLPRVSSHPFAVVALFAVGAAAQQFQFVPHVTRAPESLLPGPAAGIAMTGFAFGDTNGDGRRDAVMMESQQITVLQRLPAGGYARSFVANTGLGHWPTLRDFDGDGRPELWLAAPSPGRLRSLHLLNPQMTWQAFGVLPAVLGTEVHGADAGDVDGDGDIDIVVSPVPDGSRPPLVLLRNTGANVFVLDTTALQASLPSGLWPRLHDLDRDGDLDILGSLQAGGFVRLRNDGSTFSNVSGTLPATRFGYSFHCAGDFDGDGRDDVAAVHGSGDLDLLWGTATSFAFQPSVLPSVSARMLVPVDVDSDGDTDLIAERAGAGLDLLRGGPQRAFERVTVVDEVPSAFTVDDVQGDGVPDLVFVGSRFPNAVRSLVRATHLAQDAAFALSINLPAGTVSAAPPCACAFDLDRDGRTDMLYRVGGEVWPFRAVGDGTYERLPPQALPVWTQMPITVDIDGDGVPELLAQTATQLWLLRNTGGTFTASMLLQSATGLGEASAADVTGDARPDVIVTFGAALVVLPNLGISFGAPVYASTSPLGRAFTLIDFDGDSDRDVVVAAPVGPGVLLLTNDGSGVFATAIAPAFANASAGRILAFDADADGDQDLAIAGNALRLFANDGLGNFLDVTTTRLSVILFPATDARVFDCDEDGDQDLVVFWGPAPPSMLVNNGAGAFSLSARVGPGANLLALGVADIDDDGDRDLLLADGILTPVFFVNQLRRLSAPAPPRVGALAGFEIASGPGFSTPGLAVLAIGDLAPSPMVVPGLRGKLQLDPATIEVLAVVPTSAVGMATAFVSIPDDPALMFFNARLQAVVLPGSGEPGFTNAIFECVLW